MDKVRRRQAILENLIYGIIWLLAFVLPVVLYRQGGNVYWSRIFNFWLRLLPFLTLFIVNNYALVPCFLLRKKWGRYVISVLLSILLLISVIQPLIMRRVYIPMNQKERAMMTERTERDSTFMLPPWFHYGEPRGRQGGPPRPEEMRRPPDSTELALPTGSVRGGTTEHRGRHDGGQPPGKDLFPGGPVLKMPVFMSIMLNDWIVAIFMLGFSVAIRYLFKSIRDDRQIRILEANTLQAELNYLKAQINPHFFMNTLNNIHALVDIDAEKAKATVIELSKIMRYVLYEADQQGIHLSKEIQFIENYVSLMLIRFSDEIDIRMDFPDPVPDVRIPPMMLVTLIENAFKHGISYRTDSFIHTRLWVEGGLLHYVVENSVGEKGSSKPGVGMENMRKRLNLLYGGEYTLDARQTLEKYTVTLTIPVMP